MKKFAIILHAEPGTHDALGRALHALLYSRELLDAGYAVKLIFDGGGTKWIEEISDPDHKLNPLYQSLKSDNAIAGTCDFCLKAFDGNKSIVESEGIQLINENHGHPSLAKLVQQDYQIITL
jgi:hypothetical protein